MRPMLATPGTVVPTGPHWWHEVKWDGMRVLVDVTGDRIHVFSRRENDVSAAFPEIAGPGGPRPGPTMLVDGELVAFTGGIPSFGALADRIHVVDRRKAARLAAANPVTLLAFDLLRLDGADLTRRPLVERRSALEKLELAEAYGGAWQVPPTYDDGQMLLEVTAQQGLEGVVSKRRDSRYRPGQRSPDWLKFPHRATTSYVVGGWRSETGSMSRLGSVLVGAPGPNGLSYRGRVGSGLGGRAGPPMLERLAGLRIDASPFADEVPRVDAVGTTWVRPELVVDVTSLGVTAGDRLRQPSFHRLRVDLTPEALDHG
ncbi:MAG TPA: non-homologous end-joining DNA ligase [Nocardioidaceae bacterium]|nr:non-homologous end-joining DNA ligase [Nocardioidaceae bacterium]